MSSTDRPALSGGSPSSPTADGKRRRNDNNPQKCWSNAVKLEGIGRKRRQVVRTMGSIALRAETGQLLRVMKGGTQ